MSGHADTIRDYVTNTERYDGQWHRLPTDQETLAALDALLAENQRYEKALERAMGLADDAPLSVNDHDLLDQIHELLAEALAGDGQ